MYSYVARQPILDSKQKVVAYELLFRDGQSNSFPNIDPDKATSNILTNNHLTLGLDKITNGLPAYVNFHSDALVQHFPSFLSPDNIVIEILEDVQLTPELIDALTELKRKGYKLALDDHDFDARWQPILPLIDIIKVDVLALSIADIQCALATIEAKNITLLAEKVEDREQFEQLKQLGFTLFQGYFFAKPEMVKQRKVLTDKRNLISLIGETTQQKLNLPRITEIFASDPGLTYKLLRFINSAYYGLTQEISSLKHALVYIGEADLKRFISLLALSNLSQNKCTEITRLSLVRAKFCELLSEKQALQEEHQPKAFLTGLLSLVDGILDHDLEHVLEVLPLHVDIKSALLNQDNYLHQYLHLSQLVERGDWENASRFNIERGLPDECCFQSHQTALNWADSVLNRSSILL
ncbi:EAL and HDOD domain-containing protein [Thalassotalea marina]|uniref:Diguanylate cyclase n=1 Tax=Thalassotalea marina TaxID=1673741 RepID=A0A919BH28_9GAMM|nr:HDOD domain-containing protein [Thalassotalea marina]GHF89832.1 diguanylate cyclase [Thalassotalea marina]